MSRGGFRPHQRNARQFPLQVLLVPLPVLWRVQQPVNVMEHVPLGDVRPVLRPELPQCPIRDVVPPEFAVEGNGDTGCKMLPVPRRVSVPH